MAANPGKSWQDQSSDRVAYDASTYGVVIGAERQSREWILGIHGAASEQPVKPREAAGTKDKTTAFDLGLHYQTGDGFSIGASVAGHWYGAGQQLCQAT